MKSLRASWTLRLVGAIATFALVAPPRSASPADRDHKTLDVYWIDVEGGGGTLIVTPAGESILIDTGFPDDRPGNPGSSGPSRVMAVARDVAGLKVIDHLIITHFHIDHFGGAAGIAAQMPIGHVYDNGSSDPPPDADTAAALKTYAAFKAGARQVLNPGDSISLKQLPGGAPVGLHLLGTRQHFVEPPRGAADPNRACEGGAPQPPDTSDNKNSTVWLLEVGPFRMFDGGDLTWNTEADLVCPADRVGGHVDVYQTDHHGLRSSNNPVLVRSLAPTVVVMNNGARKGTEAGTVATLKSVPSIRGVFQVHKNLRDDHQNAAADDHIANLEEHCAGRYIKMSVEPDGRHYTIEIPGRGFKKTYEAQRR
jgi:beta-lactamase superfamily II metal-dependent hydrolase